VISDCLFIAHASFLLGAAAGALGVGLVVKGFTPSPITAGLAATSDTTRTR